MGGGWAGVKQERNMKQKMWCTAHWPGWALLTPHIGENKGNSWKWKSFKDETLWKSPASVGRKLLSSLSHKWGTETPFSSEINNQYQSWGTKHYVLKNCLNNKESLIKIVWTHEQVQMVQRVSNGFTGSLASNKEMCKMLWSQTLAWLIGSK